ncbi:MAG: hypothetical protein LUC26_01445 [Prevotella sp.]|nr:hypothetical protein [Prevotella sp.]
MLNEVPGIPSADILYDEIEAELKRVKNGNNIEHRANWATKKQGAKLVLVQIDSMTHGAAEKFRYLGTHGVKGKYFITGKEVVYDFVRK